MGILFANTPNMNTLNYYFFKILLIFAAIPFLLSQKIPQSKRLPIVPTYQDSIFSGPNAVGKLENQAIDESSGLAFSRNHPGILYTHNDSGGEPFVFLLDTLGKDVGKIRIEGVINRDWEDIAVGKVPGSIKSYIYIGEIGDNNAVHSSIQIFRFPEPKSILPEISIKPEIANFVYPDGPRDAETLMIDPISTDMYILSKRDSMNILYKAPQSAFGKPEHTLEKVLELPITMSVAGDISVDGSQIIVKNYFMVFYWERQEGELVEDAMRRTPILLPYKPEPQGEAIAFDPLGKSYFTVSEKRFNVDPVLYRYHKK